MKAHLLIFDNTICVASEAGAKILSDRFSPILPDSRYLISEVQPETKGGRMDRSILSLMNDPGSAQREPA